MTAFSAHSAFADGLGCATLGGNGICLTGPGTTIGGETIGSETVGGQTFGIGNPLPFEVCYVLGCVSPGGTIATVGVPQETTPAQTLPSQNVPVTPECCTPVFGVAAPASSTPSFGFHFYVVPGYVYDTHVDVNWGDGTSDETSWYNGPCDTCFLAMNHLYAPGVWWMSISVDNNGPVTEAVVCQASGCMPL